MSHEPVGVRDCAVLLAVPTTQESFFAAWDRGSDYLHSQDRSPADLWPLYQDHLKPTLELAEDCERLGALVCRDATLVDVARAVARYPVVVVIAHLDPGYLRADEILDVAHLYQTLSRCDAPEWAPVADALADRPGAETDIAGRLNRLIRRTELSYDQPVSELGDEAALHDGLVRVDRLLLEELFGPEVLLRRALIEFTGQMLTLDELLAVLSPAYTGLLDLSLCRSRHIARSLKKFCPAGMFLAGRSQLAPAAAMQVTKLMLVALKRAEQAGRRVTYAEALDQVVEVLA